MTFSEQFQSFVCEGDSISCDVDGYTITARVVRDDTPDRPDQRDDGFWPSLYANAPGFIGPGKRFRERFEKAQAKAQAIMDAWERGDWFYCGIVISVAVDEVIISDHAASLWGVEANYPDTNNHNLNEVANELLGEALAHARKTLDDLHAKICDNSNQEGAGA